MFNAMITSSPSTGTPVGYTIGALIALLILGYLIYSLIKPEKF
jgi:K+-transporting ATPase KdpF subunit